MSALKSPRKITPEEALARLETLCARSERCTHELRTKMRTWQISPDDEERILQRLEETKFVDDHRFANAFVRDKVRFERRGRRWIRQALIAKRISAPIIMEALNLIEDDIYQQNLDTTLRNKLRQNPALAETFESRTKLYRYVVSRGYEPDMVSSALRRILSAAE